MTGSYFYKKIILIVALVAFLAGGFYPLETEAYAPPTRESLQQQVDSGQIKKAGEPVDLPGDTQKNDQIYCFDFGGEGLTGARFSMTGCLATVAFAVLGAASWVLWLSAILFNSTINYSLNMAGFIADIPIVALGWTTFRDLANLFFVFIILYIAINTIVGNEGYGIKKLLGKVIVTAMLINFSLFFTQAMIDGSNIFALQFYHKILQDSQGSSGADNGYSSIDGGISAAFVKGLGLQEVFGIGQAASSQKGATSLDASDPSTQALGLNSGNLIIVGLGGTVLVLVTAFLFFAATFMFLARTVVLIFLMILSPMAFMGGILPALGDVTKKWWSKLFSNLLFAPAYMALLYLVISMITKGGFKGVNGGGSFYQLFSGNSNMIGAAMTFFVLNALMLGCLLIASSFGAIGSKWAEKTGMGLATGLGMTLGGANLGLSIGRGVLGGGANALLQNETIKRFAPNSMMRTLDSVRTAKFGGKSFMEAQKAKDDKLKKAYDLTAEVRQGAGESDDDFKKRKKASEAAAYERLGIKANYTSGLPILDKKGSIIKDKNLTASQKSLLASKDIKDEKVRNKIVEQLTDKEDSKLKKLQAQMFGEMTREGGARPQRLESLRSEISLANHALREKKKEMGLNDRGGGRNTLTRAQRSAARRAERAAFAANFVGPLPRP